MKNCSKYFKNDSCEYFPCHKVEGEYFSCQFCFCPLYALGEECGGNFVYLPSGVKDCSACTIPHTEGGYERICAKLNAVTELAKRPRK